MSSIYTLVLLQLTGQGEARIILALSCVVVASTLAVAISIALMRRMRKIAAQPPTKDSNIVGNESQEKESASGD